MTGDRSSGEGLTPQRIEELRARQKTEQQEASQGGSTPLSEVVSSVGKKLEGERGITEPSLETQQFIGEEGRMFSDKQIALVQLSASLFEKCAEAANSILRGECSKVFQEKDVKDTHDFISELTLKYEDLLDRKKEFSAALEMIAELRKNIPGFVKKKSNPVFTYLDIARRVAVFHHEIGAKDGKSEYAIESFHRFLDRVNMFILQRIPNEAMSDNTFGALVESLRSRGLGEVTEKEKQMDVLDKALPIDPALALELRNKIIVNIPTIKNTLNHKFVLEEFIFSAGAIFDQVSSLVRITMASSKVDFYIYLDTSGSVSLHCTIKTSDNKKKIFSAIDNISQDKWERLLIDIDVVLPE